MSVDSLFQIIILIFSVVVHEVAHGYAAYMLGDNTAKYQGRLTLNPIKHIDPFGSVVLPLILFLVPGPGIILGWAKPVPFNPFNLRNQRWGEAIVAFAGPLSNIFIALVFGLLLRFSMSTGFVPDFEVFQISKYIISINLLLAVFNLVPIPPLDGSKILFSTFRIGYGHAREFLERSGMILVLIFVFFFWGFISPVISWLFTLITGIVI